MMATTLNAMMARLPSDRRKRIKARADRLVAEQMNLRDLREARDLTQARMAELLNIGQDSVSRIERRSDLLFSTLSGFVNAMGGQLELIARFPNRSPIVVSGLGDLLPRAQSTTLAKRHRRTKTRKDAHA